MFWHYSVGWNGVFGGWFFQRNSQPFAVSALVSRIRHFGDMSDDSGGGGSWYKVPVWDGSPQTFRAFKKEMAWWTQSLDLQSTKKFNLAARWLLRQTGIVRQRGEEFDPQDLAYKPGNFRPR